MGKRTKTKKFLKNHWGKILLIVIGVPILVFAILILVAVIIAATISPQENALQNMFDNETIDLLDPGLMLERGRRLAGALKIPTISYEQDDQEFDALLQLHDYLQTNFPVLHSSPFVERKVVNTYSLLFAVRGTDTDALPYLLMSHMDVVPADGATWDVPPFEGSIIDDQIIGRGAIDDKSGVVGIMEALENFLGSGAQPKRSFYIAFGHDEEISGEQGAMQLASELRSRGVTQLEFIIDEGLGAVRDVLPGTDRPIGLLSVTEKGHMTVELTVKGHAGHSSFPPKRTTIGILSDAIGRLERHPQPSQFGSGLEAQMFRDLAPHCSFGYRILYANLWLFGDLIAKELTDVDVTNAFIRTTTAVTMLKAGIKENVVPPSATATVNLRVHPNQNIAGVVENMRRTIGDDRVLIEPVESSLIEPLPISPSGPNDVAYHLVAASLAQVLDNAIIVPGMFIAITDTRWYLEFSKNIYRLYPFEMTLDDTGTVHGDNEKISLVNYHRAVNFYYRLMKNSDIVLGFDFNRRDAGDL